MMMTNRSTTSDGLLAGSDSLCLLAKGFSSFSMIQAFPDQAVGGTESTDRISGQRVQVSKSLTTLCDHAKDS